MEVDVAGVSGKNEPGCQKMRGCGKNIKERGIYYQNGYFEFLVPVFLEDTRDVIDIP